MKLPGFRPSLGKVSERKNHRGKKITRTAHGLEELYIQNLHCFIFQTDGQTDRQRETLILIPTFKIYMFLYSRQTGREINTVWAGYPIGSSR
jgi:hypothetical protein